MNNVIMWAPLILLDTKYISTYRVIKIERTVGINGSQTWKQINAKRWMFNNLVTT